MTRSVRTVLAATLLACSSLALAIPGVQASSQPRVQTFYTTTKAAWDAFTPGQNSTTPHRTATFAHNTQIICTYFEALQSKKAVLTFGVTVRNSRMALVALHRASTSQAYVNPVVASCLVPGSGGAFAAGQYTAVLSLNGVQRAQTSFTVR